MPLAPCTSVFGCRAFSEASGARPSTERERVSAKTLLSNGFRAYYGTYLLPAREANETIRAKSSLSAVNQATAVAVKWYELGTKKGELAGYCRSKKATRSS